MADQNLSPYLYAKTPAIALTTAINITGRVADTSLMLSANENPTNSPTTAPQSTVNAARLDLGQVQQQSREHLVRLADQAPRAGSSSWSDR
jgi:hypothetical protein